MCWYQLFHGAGNKDRGMGLSWGHTVTLGEEDVHEYKGGASFKQT